MNIQVRLDAREFMEFGWFDALRHKKIWRRPALFAAILGVSALICFALHDRRGAVLLGGVLLTVALGLPAAWFLTFYLSLRRQGAGLAGGSHVYTLELHDGEGGIAVDNGAERASYPWTQVFWAYRSARATYLYITPQRAFLIPHDCVPGGAEELWALIRRQIPADRTVISSMKGDA